jgi:ABC-type lipoprotein release transport system permease subunit
MGCALAFAMNLSTHPLVGHMIDFRLHGGFVAGCAVAAVVIAVLAALLPARRAAHLDVIQALHYE